MTFSVANQRVVVVGAGRSGIAAAALLASHGARVTLSDAVASAASDLERLRASGVEVAWGPHDPQLLARADLIVLSPGVSPAQPAVAQARTAGVTVMGEIELAFRFLKGRVIAVTGTKGKSTTTTLIARILGEAGFTVTAGGNLGTALSAQAAESTEDAIHVVEVSSFQLETIETFKPWIAVLLNLSPDHLDRHASFEEYSAAKARIFENQTRADYAVVNADDAPSLALAAGAAAGRFDFALEASLERGVTVEEGMVVAREGGATRQLFPVSAVRLTGRHLLADVLAAAAVASLAGVAPSAMARGVGEFTGLEHALELVADVAGVRFVNDSKATNVVSARRAIESFDRGVVAIMGGRYKGGAFEDLRESLGARGRGVVAIGEAAPLVGAALEATVPVHRARSMAEAVREAFAMAEPGDVVLLAPGCSSFDMFSDYAARGRAFKDEVRRLTSEVTDRAGVRNG